MNLLAEIFREERSQLSGKVLPDLALAHGYLENVGKMVSSEVTSFKEEKSSMDSLPCDVLGKILWGEGERERERERERAVT